MSVVQGLWITSELPRMHRLSIQSFLAHGHDYHLYVYEDVAGVPKGTTICDASAILPPDRIFRYQSGFGKGSYSAFSNLFRYELIRAKGGWWVDTDLVCLRPFDFAQDYVFAAEYEDDRSVLTATCAFKSPADAEYLKYCIEICNSKNLQELKWSEIGPYLFDEAIRKFDLAGHRTDVQVFNPINHFEFSQMLEADFDMSRLSASYAVHLWHQRWKSEALDPDVQAKPGSLYDILRSRYESPAS